MKKKQLTARQQEIHDLLAKGLTPAETGRKAKPPISANAVYMTIRRIEEKGHKVKVKESPRGRQRGKATGKRRGRPPGQAKPDPTPPSNPVAVPGQELIDQINARLADDIKSIDTTMASNDEAREQAEGLVKRLTEENASLATTKERLEAIKK